jgi:hypothetical protein
MDRPDYSNDVYRPEDAEELQTILDNILKKPPPAPPSQWQLILNNTPLANRPVLHNINLEVQNRRSLDTPDDMTDAQKTEYYSEVHHIEQAHHYEILWHMLAIDPAHTTKTFASITRTAYAKWALKVVEYRLAATQDPALEQAFFDAPDGLTAGMPKEHMATLVNAVGEKLAREDDSFIAATEEGKQVMRGRAVLELLKEWNGEWMEEYKELKGKWDELQKQGATKETPMVLD